MAREIEVKYRNVRAEARKGKTGTKVNSENELKTITEIEMKKTPNYRVQPGLEHWRGDCASTALQGLTGGVNACKLRWVLGVNYGFLAGANSALACLGSGFWSVVWRETEEGAEEKKHSAKKGGRGHPIPRAPAIPTVNPTVW